MAERLAEELPPTDFLFELATEAAAQTLPRFRQALAVDVKAAAEFDPVTEADRAAERAIVARIRRAYPDHAILGEEYGASGKGRFRWVIDPVDGTRSFISGIPLWGTLIGLEVDGRARMGLMSQPFTGESFWADDSGAFTGGPSGRRSLATRSGVPLSEAILFTTAPENFDEAGRHRFDALARQVRLTRYGTDCYAFAMLAAGHVDLCVESPVQPYDIVALIPIIEQAGGVVTTWDGGRLEEGGTVLAAATPALHQAAMEILNR